MLKTKQPSLLGGLGVLRKAPAKRSRVEEMRAALGPRYSKGPTYVSWQSMRNRCSKPYINGYHNYGGRGITVCERWQNSFPNFFDDMGKRPDGHVLDRENTNGNYEPGNCRWVTELESQRNKRKVKLPFLPNETERERDAKVFKLWLSQHQPERKQYAKDYWKANKQAQSKKYQQWQKSNREYLNAYKRELYQKNKRAKASD